MKRFGDLREIVKRAKLAVFVGEGGVGKTSCAAATALAAASSGRRVAVLTVDPAPRLGDALGLKTIDGTPRQVELPDGSVQGGTLVAMRLDTKRTFDAMVESMAPSETTARAIVANPVYQALSASLGGSEHFMAFQRLHELIEERAYDLIVIDTPPATHAEELLATPLRLGALLETGAPAILADPARILARGGSRLAKATALALITVIERATGISLTRQVAEFIANFESLLEGLEGRTRAIDRLLHEQTTAFLLVTRPEADRVKGTIAFARALAATGIATDALIVNRVTPPADAARGAGAGVAGRVEPCPSPASDRFRGAPAGTEQAAAQMQAAMADIRAAESSALEALTAAWADAAACGPIALVAALDNDVSGPVEIALLAALLTAYGGHPGG